MDKVIVVVDGCSTGVLLAQEFNRSGFRCVHVQSSPNPPSIMTGVGGFHSHEYIAAITHGSEIESTVSALESFDIVAVVAGAEPGVEVADALAEALGVPCNAPALSRARRDKYLMAMAVADAGLRAIPTLRTKDPLFATSWIRDNGGFPAVVKPRNSGATDGVTLCMDGPALQSAFSALLGKRNILSLVNEELVVQPYMSGVEYIVDTVSADGTHRVTDIWQYGKLRSFNGASFVYDHAWLLFAEGETQRVLVDYAKRALDALGIQHGAAHCEIMLVDGEAVLIEVGARVCGGYVPIICKAAIGSSQVDALVQSIADPGGFRTEAWKPYRLKKHALRVLLRSEKRGKLDGLPRLQDIYRLDSFHAIQLSVAPGGQIERTTNFYSHPGRVDLMHTDREVLLHDLRLIRELEATDFYDIKEQAE